jgi:Family of unknown function (DUF5681)
VDKDQNSEFSVGYKKPPRHTQFKRGQSGNRNGRPKKKGTTFAETMEKELNTSIAVTEGGTQKRMTKLQAIVKQQTNRAVSGDHKATSLVMRAVEPREFQQEDNLSPVLQEMRAIHAKHELVKQRETRARETSHSDDKITTDDRPDDGQA